jgi:hypothetical protein
LEAAASPPEADVEVDVPVEEVLDPVRVEDEVEELEDLAEAFDDVAPAEAAFCEELVENMDDELG